MRGSVTACIAFLSFVFAAAAPSAQAQQLPEASIAVIDMQHVFRSSLVGQDMQLQIENTRERFKQELDKKEEALQKERLELERQRSIISPQAFEVKASAWEQKVQELQELRQIRTQQSQQMNVMALQELGKVLEPILKEMMNSRNINVFMLKSNVVRQGSGTEITTEVIDELNQRVPALKLEVPQPTAAGQANQG